MEKAQYIERAQEILSTHVYTELANTPKLVAWNCQRPNSSCYGFDILITRFGIAIVGDIDNLTFRVGLSYGLEFLAGSDLGYYIHSKLDLHCKEKELDSSSVLDFLRMNYLSPLQELVADWFDFHDDEEDKSKRNELIKALSDHGIKTPEQLTWIDDADAINKIESIDDLKEIFYAIWSELDEFNEFVSARKEKFDLFDIHDAIEQASSANCESEIYSILSDAPEGDMELSDWSFTKPAESLIQNLYIVNQAAKAILQQIATSKENQAETATQD